MGDLALTDKDIVSIVGVGDSGWESLTDKAKRIISSAELLLGGERLLEFFKEIRAEKYPIRQNLNEACQLICSQRGRRKVVVLASGDPLFYGIAKYLLSKIPKEFVEIIPNVSSIQLAFARIKESWEDALLLSAHSRPIEELIVKLMGAKKAAILTDEKNTPAKIAQALISCGLSHFKAYVCENLDGPDERITCLDIKDLQHKEFSPLNVLVLVKEGEEGGGIILGIDEKEFFSPRPGLITKSEIRAISLSKMGLREKSIIWDIGAGSGSISIESALICRQGWVYAIEKNIDNCRLIRKNMEKFGTKNMTVIHGLAPDCFKEIPQDPDAIFVGGSSGGMKEILEASFNRLKKGGRIVVNVVTMENFYQAQESFKSLGLEANSLLVSISRGKLILDKMRFESLNPVFILWAQK